VILLLCPSLSDFCPLLSHVSSVWLRLFLLERLEAGWLLIGWYRQLNSGPATAPPKLFDVKFRFDFKILKINLSGRFRSLDFSYIKPCCRCPVSASVAFLNSDIHVRTSTEQSPYHLSQTATYRLTLVWRVVCPLSFSLDFNLLWLISLIHC